MNLVSHEIESPTHCAFAELQREQQGYDNNNPASCQGPTECLQWKTRLGSLTLNTQELLCHYRQAASVADPSTNHHD